MIRLFNVYYPTRTIVLLLCEALIVSGCFLLATVLLLGPDTYLVLNYEYGGLKILGLTILTSALFLLLRSLRAPAHLSALGDLLSPAAGSRVSLFSALRDHLSCFPTSISPTTFCCWD